MQRPVFVVGCPRSGTMSAENLTLCDALITRLASNTGMVAH